MNDTFGGAGLSDGGFATVNSNVNHLVGDAATKLTRPSGMTGLVLLADKGNWRVRVGDFTASGMPEAEDPAASVTDGSGSVKITEGKSMNISAPREVTVIGFAADSVLTYWWV